MILLWFWLIHHCVCVHLEWQQVEEYTTLGENYNLFCNYKTLNSNDNNWIKATTRRWFGGYRNELIYKNGIVVGQKYSVRDVEHGFYLTIHDLTIQDLNAHYSCSVSIFETKRKLIKINMKPTTTMIMTITIKPTTKSITTAIHKIEIIKNLGTTLRYHYFCTLILMLSNHG